MAKIDKYFLEEACPFTKRRKIKWKAVKVVGVCGLALSIVMLLALTPDPEKKSDSAPSVNQAAPRDLRAENTDQSLQGDPFKENIRSAAARPPRQFNASQLVRRSDGGNSGDKLPMGSTIGAKLVNSVLTSDSNSPVIAEIPEEVYWKGGVIIPSGTKAIGQGVLDDSTERLQVRFHTLVYPEGDQHSISAMALLSDGSSGIAGDFHSRAFKKQAGRFFGNFVGGVAQGMKDREAKGQAGIAFEPGSLKNGILNGIAASSFDQAKSYADDTEHLKPYLEVPGGTQFVLYLEKEYSP